MSMLEIDGSAGEGGGQVLRTSLTLSLLTGTEFRITNIRARRKNPGLQAQHLKSVQAAVAVCNAQVEGAEPDSRTLIFRPGEIIPGKYRFDIGTAGSTSLVLQTIFLPLSFAGSTSTVTVTGGTHVPWSPCFHYLDWHWMAFMRKLGYQAELSLGQAGFYPPGGGQIRAQIMPKSAEQTLSFTERGKLRQIRGLAAVADLPRQIAERMRRQVVGRLGSRYPLNDLRITELSAPSPGAFILLLAEFEHSQCCYFSLGEKGKPAERVADEVVNHLEGFLTTSGFVDEYLADQLLLPLVVARQPGEFKTAKVTGHLLTNADVIRSFMPVEIELVGEIGEPGSLGIYFWSGYACRNFSFPR